LIGTWEYGHADAGTMPDRMLFTRIAETIGWCRMILRNNGWQPSLRTEHIRPRLLSDGIDQTVCDVGHSRTWEIGRKVYERDQLTDLMGGRLMVYFPDANLVDGAAMSASDAFFDEHNIPPWDTWISFFDDKSVIQQSYSRYLLAYVPAELTDQAARGILANPEECIGWLGDAPLKLCKRIANSNGRTG